MSEVFGFLAEWGVACWEFLRASGVALLLGFLIAGALAEFVPASLIARQLGGSGRGARLGAVLKASAIGVPMPLCSCSVIPTAAALRRQGAGKGAAAAFAISTPEVDVPSFSLTWALMGPVVAIARPTSAFLSAAVAGVLINIGDREDEAAEPDASEVAGSCCGSGEKACCHDTAAPERAGVAARTLRGLEEGFGDLPRELAGWFVLGIALSGLIAAALPPEWLGETFGADAGSGWIAKLAALVVGVPFYVCAVGSTPLAAALIAAGLSPGAAVVFLLAGPATNPATIGWAIKDLGARSAIIYVAVIAGMSLLAGYVVDGAFGRLAAETMPEAAHAHAEQLGLVHTVAGAALAALLLVGLCRSLTARLGGAGHHDHHPDDHSGSGESCCAD